MGYSRAVRVGNFIAVSGSAAIGDDGELVGVGDAYLQAQRCIEVIRYVSPARHVATQVLQG